MKGKRAFFDLTFLKFQNFLDEIVLFDWWELRQQFKEMFWLPGVRRAVGVMITGGAA